MAAENKLAEADETDETCDEVSVFTDDRTDYVVPLSNQIVIASSRQVKVYSLKENVSSLKYHYEELVDITGMSSLRGSSFVAINGNGQFIMHKPDGVGSAVQIGGHLTKVISTDEGQSIVGTFDGELVQLDESGKIRRKIFAYDSWVTALASRDGKIVSAAGKSDVIVWEALDMLELARLSHNSFILDVAIGVHYIAVACAANQINIFSNDDGYKLMKTVPGLGARKLAILSNDILICGGADGALHLISLSSGEVVAKKQAHVGSITDLANLGDTTCCVAGFTGSCVMQLPCPSSVRTTTTTKRTKLH